MNKNQYRIARRMIRENGRYALQWMRKDIGQEMARIIEIRKDELADREELFRDMGWGLHLSKSIARDIASRRGRRTVSSLERKNPGAATAFRNPRAIALAA
ncbi:hypothetical protein [Burkholderia vietnamiensis]|uniref:hypothetical protein n=1 Tax=Burkholderia cepacia complex TaxID=87882 RepID=UPI0015949D98|nr:hypothetical protein [Burkholderia vietnamiensis]